MEKEALVHSYAQLAEAFASVEDETNKDVKFAIIGKHIGNMLRSNSIGVKISDDGYFWGARIYFSPSMEPNTVKLYSEDTSDEEFMKHLKNEGVSCK